MDSAIEFLNTLARKGIKLSAEAGQLECYAQRGALTDDIRNGIVKYRSEIIALFESREKRQQAKTHKNLSRNAKEFPLSAGQKGLYILHKLHSGLSAYNIPLCLKISSEINKEALAKAWECAQEQFPILTARVIEKEGDLYHFLDDGCKTKIQQCAIDFVDDQQLLSFLQKRAKEPFDLNRGPLTRCELFTWDKRKSVLLLTIHHIVFDGTSAMILLRSLLEFYQQCCAGKPVGLSHDLHGYQEFVAWEERMLASAEGAVHARYWQQQLNGELPTVELVPDLPRPASASFEGKTLVEDLPEGLHRWVQGFSKTHAVPPSVIFLAVFQLLLHRYTSQDDIIVGMPVMGRMEQKFAAEVGYFINMVPIRTRCEDQAKLSDFLRKVQGTMLDALYHSSYPFPLMLEPLKLKHSEKNPVFQVAYAYQNFIKPDDFTMLPRQQELSLETMPGISQEGDFDLGLEIFEQETSFNVRLKYNPELYRQDTARRFIGHYGTLLLAISESPDCLLREYSVITEQEKHQLLIDYNDTCVDYPKDKCFQELFVEQVAVHSAKVAVVSSDQELTYQQLYERSRDLALYLQSMGVKPDGLIGLCMERSLDMIVGVFGILLAGGAYVPLDPSHPDERLAYMLQNSQAAIILTEEKLQAKLSGLIPADTRLIAVDRQRSEIDDLVAGLKAKQVHLEVEVKPHHLAYVIYTSGSTGKPKGVEVTHRSLVNFLCSMQKEPGITQRDTLLAVTTLSFDIAALELYLPLCVGARLVLASRETASDGARLLTTMRNSGATMLQATPVTWRLLLDAGWKGDPKLTMLCGGEALPRDLANQLLETACPLWNMYGPTETTIWSATSLVLPGTGLVPLGAPIANTQIYILDSQNNIQPIGVPGELHIAGDGLARGYLNRPELTQEKFVANPFQPGTRMYKTGDLARWLDDGNIQYLGRIDTQVKIRGFRIELGEIEACLNQHPGIEDSVLIARGQEGDKQLAAFYRAKETTADHIVQLPQEELRAHLMRSLPEYMAPAAFVSLAGIPLNPNGKVDRRALAQIDVEMRSGREYVAPGNERERELVEIWAEVLKAAPEKIGVNDNFFELGGHSLLATQLIAKIRNRLDIDVPLKAVFEQPSVAQLAGFIVKAEKSNIPPIRPVDRTRWERLPLSFAQERLWFINQLEPDSAGYNLPGAVVLHGELDINQVEEALNLIIARHENLRTVFPSQDGQAQQLILNSLDFKLDRIDLSHDESRDVRDNKAREICQQEAARPFDLARGPLLRGKVIKLGEDEHILMLNMHHIISDGWSLGILIKELGLIAEALKQGRRPGLAPMPIQYADYSVWQRTWLEEGGVLKQQLAYWQEKLAGVQESLDLATDYPRPSVQNFAGATQEFILDAELSGQLKVLAEQQGGTLFMVLLAAFKALLYRYTGQEDICVGSPIANRGHGETEGLIGMFVNTLALRSQIAGSDTFSALLGQVKATCLEAYEHQDAPFEKVVDLLQPQRNMAISPLFQVMVTLQNAALWGNAGMGAPHQHIQPYRMESGISKFELSVDFTEAQEGLTGSAEYSTALFKRQTIARMVDHFIALCRAITATPTAKICELDYIDEAEKHQLLIAYNDTCVDYPRDKCIHDLFVEQVRRNPSKTAVLFGNQELSYQELYDKSRDLALYLQSKGVKPDTLVGLCVERSLDMVVGLMGILQAGGAYVPLDPDYPDGRLAYMLEDSRAEIILTQENLRYKLNGLAGKKAQLIALDQQWPEINDCVAAAKAKKIQLLHQVKPHHLAYVIYTSGSTGQPRGVMVEHGSVVNHNIFAREKYRITSQDIQIQFSSISFDLFVEEVFVVLNNGAQLVIEQKDKLLTLAYLKQLIESRKITTLNLPTAFFHELVASRMDLRGIKNIIVGGEELAYLRARAFMDKFQDINFHNTYGPTEATIISAAVRVTQDLLDEHRNIPIGTPIANTQIYILDSHNNLQPIGVPGELHIAGDGLARGYLNRPELTQEKFVANPFQPGKRMYKTGDLARWLDDGNIQYLGRIDTQVKIRGFRIELGEIEACLNQHPGIEDSVVIARGQEGDKQLAAFYRAKETTADHIVQLPPEELRAHLMRSLPEYMAPTAFMSLAGIPLNPNGKVDRRALAQIDVEMRSGREYVAPGNERERELVEIWAEVLKATPEKIGVNDNFFELGGHSLLATQLIAKIRSRLDIDLPLKAVFEQPSVAQLAGFIVKAEKSNIPPIRPVDRTQWERLPLSFAQERLWFINQLEPDSAGYSIPGAVTIGGELDVSQVEEAINLIIARHENLRTLFPNREGQAQQLILDSLDFKLERIDLSDYQSGEERDGKAREICQSEAAAPFDLTRGPLLRGKVIKLGEHEHILMLNMHHIISDGWSLGVLIKELGLITEALKQGRRPELAVLPVQYADYSVWQRTWLEEGGVLKQQLAYWQEKLAGVQESLDLATDYPRPSVQRFAGATHKFAVDAQLAGQLKVLAEQQGCTLFMVLLAAFKVLLYRYTGQNDICVGSPIANRGYEETEGLIGMFVNTLALRSQVAGKDTFATLLTKVKTTCLEGYEHQDAPFEKVVDLLRPQRNLAITPLFQVMFILQNADAGTLEQHIQPYRLESGISKFDLSVEFTEARDGLAGSIEYSTALYKPQTIARMAGHFTALCKAIFATTAARIDDLDYIGEAEKHQLLTEYNDTGADYPRDRCIHDFFVEQVRCNPGRTAVVFGEQELSYQELEERSGDLALYLQSLGVKPDSVVGLCVERSLEMMVGIMGIVRAGGAYLPADPTYPDNRLQYMLQDSKAAVVLTQERFRDKVKCLFQQDVTLVALDTQWPEISQSVAELKAKGTELRREVQPSNLSYLIYTSGSTGKPKGVLVEHGALVNRIHWMQKRYPLTAADVIVQKTPYSFDVSVWEFFWPMMTGSSLVFAVPDGHKDVEYLENLINHAKVTTLHFVPSMLRTFLENADVGSSSVQQIFCSGEALDKQSIDDYKKKFPNAVLHNLYGPTEAAIDVTAYDCSQLNYPFVPIGAPIANTQIYILDSQNNIQPIGVPGELHIAGDGLARGYLNRPELTQEKFVANPFQPGTRMYKTGDLARWLDDGNIQYLGRIDTQVKIRGFRIELGEIEACLNQHPGIEDSVVIARGQEGDKQLAAFYRAKETTADHIVQLPQEELRAHLMRSLPDYMAPAAFVSLAGIPLNPNGKVDRRALAQIDVEIRSGREYVAPGNERERELVEIWAEVLKAAPEKIGINDNFFELGGHSLLATQLIAKIRSRLDIDLPLKAVFEQPSVSQLARFIVKAEKSNIPPIRPVDRTQWERLPLSFAQERLWFINQLEPDSAGYNLPGAVVLHGELDINRMEEAINLIIARHENLRTVFPSQDGQAQQLILNSLDFKLDRIDLSHEESRDVRDGKAREICQSEAAAPFDLARGPLLRGKVIKLGEDEHILMLNMHHIISDGWSLGVLIKELGLVTEALKQGRRPELAVLPVQYADYSVWQRSWLEEGGVLKQQLAYWQEKLAGVPESLDLATDYPRPSVQSFAGATQEFILDAELTGQLKMLAEQQGGTLFMVLLAAFKALLYRYTRQEDICVGSPIANRQYGETEGLIGMFVNTLALRSQVEGEDTFAALLTKVKATCLEAYEHQDAPFEKVVDLLQPQRNLAISPLFQVTVTLQNADKGARASSIQSFALESGISKFDLSVAFTEVPQGLAGSIEYSTALYKPQTIARMLEHFAALCRAITAVPAAMIRDLDYISEAEKRQLLIGYNNTKADYSKDKCVHQLFVEQAALHSEKTAVISGDEQLTYGQLYERSQNLALYLQAQGVKPDSLVGICLERSLEMVVGLLGIMQAGGAYVPLDSDYPEDRLAYMLQDSKAEIVLTQEKLQNKLTTLVPAGTRLVALDRQWPQIGEHVAELKAKNLQLQQQVKPHHLAYVIYTSGSTGQPKGVMNEHRGVVNRLIWMQSAYALCTEDAVLQKTPFSFDVSVWEFFWPLLTGARLVMARPEGHKDPGYLVDTIRRQRITTLHFVPPMLQAFLEHSQAEQCSSLTRVICSGEALPSMLARRFRERLPQTSLYNLYGPTEAAVDVTEWTCSAEKIPTTIPIGRPIANTQIYILDREGKLVPRGVIGELYIGGVQVARGYLNRPELTAERFLKDPFSSDPGARMYKTGDLGRWQDDGTIEYVGRTDFQVKIRGFRIELGEIEARLMEHEGVQEAVVLAREDRPGERRLVAYYTPSPEHAFPVVQLLRLRETEVGVAAKYCTLPNGLTVFHQNKGETDFVYNEIFTDEIYLRHGITLNAGDCIFDVGANIGLFSIFVGQRHRNTTIYAFEPIPPVFKSLQLNAALHGLAGKVYECGLAETSKQEIFNFYPHNTVISSSSTNREEAHEIVKSYLLNQPEGGNGQTGVGEFVDELLEARLQSEQYTCQLRTISEIIEENGVEKIDLLKIDVEKGEQDVLKGIRDCDWPRIRQVVMEVHDVPGRLVEIVGLLNARGYEVNYEKGPSLQSTALYNLYAFRPTAERNLTNGHGKVTQATVENVWNNPESLLHDVRSFLSKHLPEYMVPAAYVPLCQMPLTPNGKLDRKKLPAPEAGAFAVRAYEPPQGEIEIALARVWSELLKIERIGRNDSFFDLGGHSLAAVQLMAKINREFNQLLPLAAIFTAPNIAALAKLVASGKAPSNELLVPIQTNGNVPPIFGIPGAGGNVLSLQPFSRMLGDKQPFYGLQAVGLDGSAPPLNSVEQTAQANIAAMKTIQPRGPYTLVGHSYGGVVAYEMARILLEQAEQISSLILLDSIAPLVMQGEAASDEATELFEACTALANLYGTNLNIDAERLQQSSSEENIQYVIDLLNGCGVEINREQFAVFYKVYQANLLCYRTYQPSLLPREIDVSLYRATQGHADGQRRPRDYGWNQLVPGSVRIFEVEADHFSMLQEPHIQKIAGAFSHPTALAASY